MFIKKLLIGSCIILFALNTNNASNAKIYIPGHNINMIDSSNNDYDGLLLTGYTDTSSPNWDYIYFSRSLFLRPKQIKDKFKDFNRKNTNANSSESKLTGKLKGQKLSYAIQYKNKLFAKASYFINSGKNIGYNLIQRQYIDLDANNYPGDRILDRNFISSKLQEIEALPSQSYPIPNTPYQLVIHSTMNDNYIEKYGVITVQNKKYLVLDAFYPKELDNNMSSETMDTLTQIIQSSENWYF